MTAEGQHVDDSWQFVTYFFAEKMERKAVLTWGANVRENLPHYQTIFDDPSVRKHVGEVFAKSPPRHYLTFFDLLKDATPRAILPERALSASDLLNSAYGSVWDGTQTARQAMAAVVPKINALLGPQSG